MQKRINWPSPDVVRDMYIIKDMSLKEVGKIIGTGAGKVCRYCQRNNIVKSKEKLKFGTKTPAENSEVRMKMMETNIQRYGHICPYMVSAFKESSVIPKDLSEFQMNQLSQRILEFLQV
jgi:hypothetical protein